MTFERSLLGLVLCPLVPDWYRSWHMLEMQSRQTSRSGSRFTVNRHHIPTQTEPTTRATCRLCVTRTVNTKWSNNTANIDLIAEINTLIEKECPSSYQTSEIQECRHVGARQYHPDTTQGSLQDSICVVAANTTTAKIHSHRNFVRLRLMCLSSCLSR